MKICALFDYAVLNSLNHKKHNGIKSTNKSVP